MEILQKDDGRKGMFYVERDGHITGQMIYVWAGDKIIIEHTEVPEELEGKGIGKQLVMKAVDMAREKNIKIIPLCPFANKILRNKEEYKDVLLNV